MWITKHGFPSHNARFVRWEVTASAYTHRGQHVLLFSCLPAPQGGTVAGEWIEVRHVPTGQLRQVVPARDARLAQNGTRTTQGPVLVAMRSADGANEREHGAQDVLVELVETVPISHRPSPSASRPNAEDMQQIWQEFGI